MTKYIIIFSALLVTITAQANNNVSANVASYGDKWISTVDGSVGITEEFTMNAQVDSTGYLSLGGGYGDFLDNFYIEVYGNYGRAEYIDVYDVGVFAITPLNKDFTVYANTSHQWRKTHDFLDVQLSLFDQREWTNTLGLTYHYTSWLDVDISISHDRLLSGNRGINAVENDNINSQDITVTYIHKWAKPYIRYIHGQYRVSPGEPITSGSSLEFGISLEY